MPNRLAYILEDLLSQAKKQAGVAAHRKLQNGLAVSITVIQHDVTITIGRQESRPDMKEWDTIMKNFPYVTPQTMPTPIDKTGKGKPWLCITAKVPSDSIMQMKF